MASTAFLQLKDANGEYPVIDFLQPLNYDRSVYVNPSDTNIYTLSIVPGSWISTPVDENRVREEFTVFTHNNEPNRIRYAVRTVSRMLRHAQRFQTANAFGNEIRLWHRAGDENDIRAAFVYSGSIEETDHEILGRGMRRSPSRIAAGVTKASVLFKVTIVRDMYWEHQSADSQTGGEWLDVSTHGGTKYITRSDFPGDTPGRVSVFRLASDGGWIAKAWIGMKEARSGSLVTGWNPKIKTGDAYQIIGNSSAVPWPVAAGSTDSDFIDGTGVKVRFWYNLDPREDWSDWRYHVHFQITKWNSTTSTDSNLENYYGDYYLLLRYKTTDIGNANIGIRAATGYRYLTNLNPMERIYLENTDDEFRYVNLGKMTIGGEGWTQEMRQRIFIQGFRIYLEFALIDGDFSNDEIYLDNMYLVPADHYASFDLDDRPFAGGARAELYQHIDNSVSGFVVGKYEDGVDIPLNTREVLYGISDLTTENWGWPLNTFHSPALVVVVDREDGFTKSTTAKCFIDAQIARRSLGYSS